MNTKQLDKKLNSAVGGLEKTVLLAEVDALDAENALQALTPIVKVIVGTQHFEVTQMHYDLTIGELVTT